MPEDLQRLLTDPNTKRDRIRQKSIEGIKNLFPIEGRDTVLEAADVQVKPKLYSSDQQKEAIMKGRTLHEPVNGTLRIRSKKDGKIISEKKNHNLLHLPYFTDRHTFIVGGNEYDVPNQLRLKPGVYTRERGNGEFEAAFNLSKGSNFRLSMEPESGKLNMELGTTKVPLYPLLRAVGVPDSEIKSYWGSDLKDMNASAFKGKEEVALNKVINKIKRKGDTVPPTVEGKKQFILDYLDRTEMDPEVNARTLGSPLNKANSMALLRASQKLIDVQKGQDKEDDRDSLEFKTVHSVDDFFKERLDIDARRTIAKKLGYKLNQAKGKPVDKVVPNSTFTKSLNSFLTTSSLSSIPMQINPVEIMDQASRVTSLGEGGIASERAIPFESRKVHNTHMGILDPVRTAECADKYTEVYTKEGWKAWPSITEKDLLACRVEGKLEFHYPTHLVAKPYKGKLYGVKTGKVEYLVTPNHRVLCRPYEYRGKPRWRIDSADAVHGKARQFDTGHDPYEGKEANKGYFYLPKVSGANNVINAEPIDIHDWAAFMGWYLSEGHCVYDEEYSRYYVHISQSKQVNPDCCEIIEALLDRLPFKWKYNESCRSYIIGVKQLASYLDQFGLSHSKFIPEELFDAPIKARENMLEALLLGDGRINSYRSNGRFYKEKVYTTTSQQLAKDVERLAISLGWATKIRCHIDNREKRYLDVYYVRLMQHRLRAALPKKKHYYTVDYDDYVYCAEVPGSLLYMRRNGSVGVWTGNSFKAGIDVRAGISALRDNKGNMYAIMKDNKTNKLEYVPATTLAKSTVAFPGQTDKKKKWDAVRGDDVVSVDSNEVDYQAPDPTQLFSVSTASIPLLNGMQGNRAIMGSNMQTQALPLIDREAPFVQTAAARPGHSMEQEIAKLISPVAPSDGVVTKVDKDYIYFQPEGPKTAAPNTEKIPYNTFFPLSSKTYLHNNVKVKPGDKVKQDQTLADSNFTKDDTLALGKNMSVGYMAYYGKNSNDAVVISEGASKKFTSEHMYKESLSKGTDVILGKDKYRAYYPNQFTAEQLNKLDSNGVAKKGAKLEYGDPVILGLKKSAPTPEAALLGSFHKSLVKPYRDIAVTWDKHVPGEIQDSTDSARQVMVTIRTLEPMKVGDKLANRYGGKGVVSEIVPDNQMVQDEEGKPVDVLFTSAGVVSRINPSQIVEASLGKAAEKRGKPYVLPQFMDENNVKYAKNELKKNGLKDKETVYDPVSGKHIPNVFVGRSYLNKLFKSTETNYAARGVSDYDVNLQPTKGGAEGAKSIGKMEMNALLAHNARNALKEDLTTKSEKSDEFWRAFEFGLPAPPPKTPFVSDKFVAQLQGAGINVNKQGSQVALGPMTDDKVKEMSSGPLTLPPLDKSKSFMVSAKNMRPEKGGLFDPTLTGGLNGDRWSHMELAEPVVNPVFEEPVRRLLGYTKQQLKDEINKSGGDSIKRKLNRIDLDKKEKELMDLTKKRKGADLDNAVKQLKYVRALKKEGYKPGDAYTLSKVPVAPPVFRPILPSHKGSELQVADVNYLYRDVGLASEALKGIKDLGLPESTAEARKHLHETTGALFGMQPPASPQLQGRQVKGYIEQITGSGSPKSGFLHKKILKRQQDLSGRATATPDNSLDMDQIGIPEDMLWTTYSKFIMRGLIGQGYKPAKAAEMVEERHPAAKAVLDAETKKRPVFVNRAPSLHKHNFVASYPVGVPGKSLRVNPFMEKGQNLDYDGDTMQIHVPVSDKAMAEAQNLTLSKLLFSDKHRDDLMIFPQHESVLGNYIATSKVEKGKPKKFKSKAEAMKAYRNGEITMNTPIEIG